MVVKVGDGFGTVYYNKQRDRYSAQYMEYNLLKDKYERKTKTFKTKYEAEKYLSSRLYQRDNALYIINHGIPLCEFMKAEIKRKYDFKLVSPTQYMRVLRTIEQIEKYPIGSKKIDEIDSREIQCYLNEHVHLSNSTLSKIYGQFNQAFKRAMDKGYLIKNPMIDVFRPRSMKQNRKVRALTVEEQKRFTEYLIHAGVQKCKYKNVFLIQMYMGLRVGEALALTTSDIDIERKTIRVFKTLTTDENGRIIMGKDTKTYSGKRIVPIPSFIIPHVIEQMRIADCMPDNSEKLLFKPNNATYTRRTNVNSELHRILEKNFNIKDISTHSLRHSYGTRCIESGMAPVVVQRLMGHTDVFITLNTYITIFDKYKEKEVEKLNNYYFDENIVTSKLYSIF